MICRVIGYKLPVPTMSFKRAFSRVNVAIKPSPKLFTVQTNSIAATAITPQHSTIRHHSSQFSDESQSFSKFAENWWDESGEMKALHSLNKLRVPFIRDCLLFKGGGQRKCAQPLKGLQVLDVGCGVGLLSEPLARLGASVTGVDTSAEVLQVAQSHKGNDNMLADLQYLDSPVEDLVMLGDLKFDCIVASEVIEHVPCPREFVKTCSSLLNDGGSIIISTLNRNYLSYALAIFLAENVFFAAPKGTHQLEKFVTPDELTEWLQESGCFVTKIHGMSYLPIINKWNWVESTSVNYIIHAAKADCIEEEEERTPQRA